MAAAATNSNVCVTSATIKGQKVSALKCHRKGVLKHPRVTLTARERLTTGRLTRSTGPGQPVTVTLMAPGALSLTPRSGAAAAVPWPSVPSEIKNKWAVARAGQGGNGPAYRVQVCHQRQGGMWGAWTPPPPHVSLCQRGETRSHFGGGGTRRQFGAWTTTSLVWAKHQCEQDFNLTIYPTWKQTAQRPEMSKKFDLTNCLVSRKGHSWASHTVAHCLPKQGPLLSEIGRIVSGACLCKGTLGMRRIPPDENTNSSRNRRRSGMRSSSLGPSGAPQSIFTLQIGNIAGKKIALFFVALSCSDRCSSGAQEILVARFSNVRIPPT